MIQAFFRLYGLTHSEHQSIMNNIKFIAAVIFMTSDILIKRLHSIIGQNDRDAFIEKAIKLEQTEYSEKHLDWFRTYPLGIYADLYKFPENYVRNNFDNALILCIVSSYTKVIKENEFFNASVEQRRKLLKDCRKEAFVWNELRLRTVTPGFLKKEVGYYADENGIPSEEQDNILPLIDDNASAAEIGGCYCGDYNYILVNGDHILMVDCGIWD